MQCENHECTFNVLGACDHGIFSQFDVPKEAFERWQQYGHIHKQGPKIKNTGQFKKGHGKIEKKHEMVESLNGFVGRHET